MAILVNGEQVEDSRIYRTFLQISGGVAPEFVQRTDPESMRAWQRMAEQEVLEQIVLMQAARTDGIQVTPAEVEEERRKSWGTDAYLVCGAGLRADLEEALLRRKMDAHVTRHVPRPSQTEVQAAYQHRARQYAQPARVNAQQILYPAETAQELAAGTEVLTLVQHEIKRGKAFSQVAAKVGRGTTFRELGWVKRNDLVPELEEALFGLRAGQVSQILQTIFGLHLLKAVARHEARLEPFADVKQALARSIWDERRHAVRGQVLRGLLQRADIQVLSAPGTDQQGATA